MLQLCRQRCCCILQCAAIRTGVLSRAQRVCIARRAGVSLSVKRPRYRTSAQPWPDLTVRHICNINQDTMSAPVSLHKDDFAQTLSLKALKVQAKQCQSLMKAFTG